MNKNLGFIHNDFKPDNVLVFLKDYPITVKFTPSNINIEKSKRTGESEKNKENIEYTFLFKEQYIFKINGYNCRYEHYKG